MLALAKLFRRRMRLMGKSWRVDKTYIMSAAAGLGSVPIAATTRHLIQATQEGLDRGGIILAERGAMGGD